MILFAVISAVCGMILGRSFPAFVLVPASFLVWVLALFFAWAQSFSLFQSLAAAMLLAACLQLGYLFAAAVTDFRKARRNCCGSIATF
jgi:hypothetical protein